MHVCHSAATPISDTLEKKTIGVMKECELYFLLNLGLLLHSRLHIIDHIYSKGTSEQIQYIEDVLTGMPRPTYLRGCCLLEL